MTVRVLETTIRDGGYEISHQFTEEDVGLVVTTLEAAGVSLIEVGYGMGVGAQKFPPGTRPKEKPVADDLAHMRTARASAKRAKIGVLFGAGDIFCPPEYLDEVAAAGIDFVRLAFMPGDVTPANMKYVERARKLGMIVSINLMQTYILPPADIARLAKMCHSAGTQWWYVVDSAGGMQPDEVRGYVRAVREACDIEIGLHAHNNLGMAVANSLAAVDEGATLVDCTLNGLGRATGNAPTEQLILALQMRGHEPGIDVEPIARLSQMYRVLFEDKGNNPMHFVSGASMLHSRNVPAVVAEAKQRGVSLADFMVRVGREARAANSLDRFQFPPEVFERAASASKRAQSAEPDPALVQAIAGRLSAHETATLEQACDDLALRAARYHLPSVLHLVPAQRFPFARALPWQSRELVGASLPWTSGQPLGAHRQVDYVVVDRELVGRGEVPIARRRTLTSAWSDLWHDAIRAAVTALAGKHGDAVWLAVGDELGASLRARLTTAGLEVTAARRGNDPAILVAEAARAEWTTQLRAGDVVILVDAGRSARSVVDAARRAGAQVVVPPIGAIVAARAGELIALGAELEQALGAGGDAAWASPLVAPGSHEAIVDLGLGSIIDPGDRTWDELATEVARARARTLTNGTGRP